MRSGLVALLAGESTVSDLVASRIYINKAPQSAALPYIIITQMGSEQNTTMDGGSNLLRFVDFDIDCKADRSVEAESLANAVRVFLDDYKGTAGSFTIAAVLMNDEVDDYEPPVDASDVGLHVVTLDATIHFQP